MGCDIHLFVEVRRTTAEKNALPPAISDTTLARVSLGHQSDWQLVVVEWGCLTCKGTGRITDHRIPGELRECYWCDGTGKVRGFHDRNYHLFSLLADVRNYDEIEPIAEERGWPEDMSPQLRFIVDHINNEGMYDLVDEAVGESPGDHTPSWLTLRELQEFADEIHTVSGIVSRDWFDSWDRVSAPNVYCRGTSGTVVTAAEADAGAPSQYVSIEWGETRKELAGSFFTHFVPELEKLGGPDDVRIVFNFDN